jgi:hypothetical protein
MADREAVRNYVVEQFVTRFRRDQIIPYTCARISYGSKSFWVDTDQSDVRAALEEMGCVVDRHPNENNDLAIHNDGVPAVEIEHTDTGHTIIREPTLNLRQRWNETMHHDSGWVLEQVWLVTTYDSSGRPRNQTHEWRKIPSVK